MGQVKPEKSPAGKETKIDPKKRQKEKLQKLHYLVTRHCKPTPLEILVLISAAANFFFHSLGEPLLHHRLVIEKAGSGDALDSGKHAGVKPQGDGGGFLGIG